jgi:hypothetical protein
LDLAAEEAVDHAVVAAHESTVDRNHNMKGYAILSIHHISHGPGLVQAGMAVDSPETGAAWWRFTGVVSGEGS